MKARPTIYKGIQMRSRLEASFATWLDSRAPDAWRTGPWTYEPECFADETGQYLPDFGFDFDQIGRPTTFVELKPPNADFDAAARRMNPILSTIPGATLIVITSGGQYPDEVFGAVRYREGIDGAWTTPSPKPPARPADAARAALSRERATRQQIDAHVAAIRNPAPSEDVTPERLARNREQAQRQARVDPIGAAWRRGYRPDPAREHRDLHRCRMDFETFLESAGPEGTSFSSDYMASFYLPRLWVGCGCGWILAVPRIVSWFELLSMHQHDPSFHGLCPANRLPGEIDETIDAFEWMGLASYWEAAEWWWHERANTATRATVRGCLAMLQVASDIGERGMSSKQSAALLSHNQRSAVELFS